jgi:hypothetical protein
MTARFWYQETVAHMPTPFTLSFTTAVCTLGVTCWQVTALGAARAIAVHQVFDEKVRLRLGALMLSLAHAKSL